ncbi:MAG TPA: tRNA (guanosine(46)-N7)-methyltransferase TrmB [Bacilli bacterium]
MRLRGNKRVKEWMERENRLIVRDHKQNKGKWREFFGNDKPIFAELGMGKGGFISEMSLLHPEANFIGIDMYDLLIGRAAELAFRLWREQRGGEPDNLALMRMNIEYLEEAFADGEIERIYLNFSDPWPKARHARRRLTHPRFLQKYMRILNERGEIHFKTDSPSLFEFSLNAIAETGLKMRNISLDLHKNGNIPGNVMTEYEKKFVQQGKNIFRLEIVKQPPISKTP